jgi:methylated-DNA-[protein]-cysteine S-methyltransferase
MEKAFFYTYHRFQLGELILGDFDNQLCLCDWRYRKARKEIDARIQFHCGSNWQEGETEVLAETRLQLDEYFSGNRQEFQVPLFFAGTEFQKKVWNALMEIPFGQTISYLNLAKKLNNPEAVRAVAAANGANATSIIVPCHRVIGENGKLTGYAGGLTAKRKLLNLERASHPNHQLELFHEN